MLAVTVSIKLWSDELRGLRILVRTDNLTTEIAVNTGRSRVPFIQSCLRDLWFYASLYDFELRALHIPGYANVIADALSRWDTHPQYRSTFYEAASFIMTPSQSAFALQTFSVSNAYGNHFSIWLQVSNLTTFNSASPGFKSLLFLTLPYIHTYIHTYIHKKLYSLAFKGMN